MFVCVLLLSNTQHKSKLYKTLNDRVPTVNLVSTEHLFLVLVVEQKINWANID